MNTATIILKNGTKISDKISDEESEGLFFAWQEYLKNGKAPDGAIHLNGLKTCAVVDPRDISAIVTE